MSTDHADLKEPEVGSRWLDQYGALRVLAVVEGYVVARRYRAMPFIYSGLQKWYSECRPDPIHKSA